MLRAFARLLLRICFSRRTLKIACLLLLVAGATILIADRVMVNASKQLTWSDVNAVPARNVGLLLGARPGNRYFTRRIDTAAALYHAGKVKCDPPRDKKAAIREINGHGAAFQILQSNYRLSVVSNPTLTGKDSFKCSFNLRNGQLKRISHIRCW